MTAEAWGCCSAARRPGELLTRGDVCHVHADLLGGATELVRLDEIRPAVYRVAVVAVERREWTATSPFSGLGAATMTVARPTVTSTPSTVSMVGHGQGPQPRDHRVEAVRSGAQHRPARSARPWGAALADHRHSGRSGGHRPS